MPKPGSTTTPLRIVSNSSLDNNGSGHSYNGCLAKSLDALTLLLEVVTTFRSYENVLVWDLHKAYNSMYTYDEMHCRRFVWCFGDETASWKTFIFTRVHFGDRPAAVCMEKSREFAITSGRHHDPDTVKKMAKGGYMDDHVNCDTVADLLRVIGNV